MKFNESSNQFLLRLNQTFWNFLYPPTTIKGCELNFTDCFPQNCSFCLMC